MQKGSVGIGKGDLKHLLKGAQGLMEDMKDEDMTVKKIFQIMKELSLGMDLMNRKLDEIRKNMGIVVK